MLHKGSQKPQQTESPVTFRKLSAELKLLTSLNCV